MWGFGKLWSEISFHCNIPPGTTAVGVWGGGGTQALFTSRTGGRHNVPAPGCLPPRSRVPHSLSRDPSGQAGLAVRNPWSVCSHAALELSCPGFHGEEPNPIPQRVTISPSFTTKFWTLKGLQRLRQLCGAARVETALGPQSPPRLTVEQVLSPPPTEAPCA